MKNLSELDLSNPDEIAPGELVQNVATRSPDFKSIWFESSIVARTAKQEFVISLLVSDRLGVGYQYKVKPGGSGAIGFDVDKVLGHESLLEVGQLRVSQQVAVELALVLLEEVRASGVESLAPVQARLSELSARVA